MKNIIWLFIFCSAIAHANEICHDAIRKFDVKTERVAQDRSDVLKACSGDFGSDNKLIKSLVARCQGNFGKSQNTENSETCKIDAYRAINWFGK